MGHKDTHMSRILRFLKRLYSLNTLFILVLMTVLGGGGYYWHKKTAIEYSHYKIDSLPTAVEKEDANTHEQSEEKDEESDDQDEEEVAQAESPWSLLKTAVSEKYSQPSFKNNSPKVTIILFSLGLNRIWTNQVMSLLKGKITLAFSPYSPNLDEFLQQAVNRGYQALISLPMEPYAYPNLDPGPYTVLAGVKPEENIKKVKAILRKIPKGMGVLGEYGTRFTISSADLEPVLKEVKEHQSIFIDSSSHLYSQVGQTCKLLETPCYQIDMKLSSSINYEEADDFFKKVIQNAKENDKIIISVPAIPAFVNHLLEWIDMMEKNGITLTSVADHKTSETPLVTPKENL
ncbi:MAG: divergent polysaccharide deacetylase family protein, partial [Alphaproteobacteria bacterium]|nr:divergent polysaccharide deacetylase family protein [Alphaproteobacteria bacterium]